MVPLIPAQLVELIVMLKQQKVDFIVVGGVAASLHGSARSTQDLDIVYRRSDENISRLIALLEPHSPYLRGVPPGLPFVLDGKTVKSGLNFTLTTDVGAIDLLGEIAGGGTYEDLLPYTESMEAGNVVFDCVNLDKLIHLKRAAGRPKDLEVIAELEALWEVLNEEDELDNDDDITD